MQILDAHTHVVSRDLEHYPLDPRDLSGDWYHRAPADADELARAMDEAGVARAVLVQGVGAYGYDNRYVADAASGSPDRFASACAIDAEAEDAAAQLEFWVRERGVAGVRLFALSRDGPSWLASASVDPVWDTAQALKARIIVTLLPHQLDELDEALERHPTARVSLDHCAFALGQTQTRTRLFELARHPGLLLKLTTHNIDEASREDRGAREMVCALVEAFGAERLMWGSDYCQIHDRPYTALVDQARAACADLGPAEREAVLGGTTQQIWFSDRDDTLR